MEWDVHYQKPTASLIDGQLSITPAHKGISFLGVRPKTGDYCFQTEVVLLENPSGIRIYPISRNRWP